MILGFFQLSALGFGAAAALLETKQVVGLKRKIFLTIVLSPWWLLILLIGLIWLRGYL